MTRHGWFSQQAADRGDIVQFYAGALTGEPVRVTWVTTTDNNPGAVVDVDLQYQGPVGRYLKTDHGCKGSCA